MSESAATAVLELAGDVDARAVERYYERASGLLRPGVDQLVIDFARAGLIDSSGIGMLVRIHDLATIDGSAVRLRNVGPRVMSTLELAGMRAFLPIDATAN